MENHEYCQVVQGDVLDLPRRVIDVSDPQKPCIRVEVQQKEQYLTLSYCWGEGRRLLTKIETIAEYEKGIPLDKLPRTFKDAIDLTHHLGFRYLWIDALCIIQDSKEDFERETSQMGRIYRDCTLTISAAGGSNADSGLFVKRDPRWYKPCRLGLSIKDANDDLSGTLFVLKATNEDPQPLHDRGWVLQEEVLLHAPLPLASNCYRGVVQPTVSMNRIRMRLRTSQSTRIPGLPMLLEGFVRRYYILVQ